jgi:dienelactone hydrolase
MVFLARSGTAAAAPVEADPFAAYHTPAVPPVLRDLPATEPAPAGLVVRRFVFKSRTVTTPAGGVDTEVYAVFASPTGSGPFPGIVVYHGGKGKAEEQTVLTWARRGYAAVSCDLPGIVDPAGSPHSAGFWKALPYGGGRWRAEPDASASVIFDAVVAGLEVFDWLAAQPSVDRDRVGVIGTSWGGYMATMVAGLRGNHVKAAYSIFGCGFYETAIFANEMAKMSPVENARWLRYLDAGRRAPDITASYFIAAPSNDTYFYPPAVTATYDAIRADKRIVIVPGADHSLKSPDRETDARGFAEAFFAIHLLGRSDSLPSIRTLDRSPGDAPGKVRLMVDGPQPFKRIQIFTTSSVVGEWKNKTWVATDATPDGGAYVAELPSDGDGPVWWFVLATDARGFAISTPARLAGAPPPRS